MLETLLDLIGLIVMFGLRIGVPVALTYFVGRWLEKKLRPAGTETVNHVREDEMARRAASSKIIRLHCWDVRKTDSAKRAQIAAAKRPDLPCWLALQAEGEAIHEECYACAFYKPQTKAA